MALPVLDKVYSFVTNVDLKEKPLSPTTTQLGQYSYGNILLAIKNQLVAWGWTVEGSSDGATAALDTVDRWTDYTKVVGWKAPGTPTSWIVLKRANAAGAGKHLYLLIHCKSGTVDKCAELVIVASYNVFAGGSTTACPTSTTSFNILTGVADEYSSISNDDPCFVINPAFYIPTLPLSTLRGIDVVFHSMRSNDGEVERIIICCNNVVAAFISFEKVKSPVTGWTHPFLITWVGTNTVSGDSAGATSYALLNDGGNHASAIPRLGRGVAYHDGVWMTCYHSAEAHVSAMLGERITYYNEISGEYTMCPVGVVSNFPGLKGHHGFLYDIWWGSVETLTGDTFPGDETQQFCQFGNLIFPWDGSTPVTV